MKRARMSVTEKVLCLAAAVLLVIAMVITVSWLIHVPEMDHIEAPIERGTGAPKVPYNACVKVTDLATDTMLILIDLSDTTNFPHSTTDEIILKGMHYHGCMDANQMWQLSWGVVTENDVTDGSVTWLHRQCRNRIANFDERRPYAEHGLNTRIMDGVPVYFVSNHTLTSTSVLSSGAILTSPVGTSSPSVGDIVVYLHEIADGAVLCYAICADYDTE